LREHEEVFLCEGESDALVGLSLGLPCVTLTGGAKNFDRKLLRYFKDKIIYIMYDNDEAGETGAKKIAGYLKDTAKEVFIVNLPVENEKEDLTDLVIKYNASKEDILHFTKSAEIDTDENENKRPIRLGLRQLGFHKYINKQVQTSALVVGRETETYVVPKEIELICPKGTMPKKCGICPFASEDDLSTITINDVTMIELMNKPDNQHKKIIKAAENIPCNKFDYYIKKHLNLTELQLMPSLDNEETGIILYAITKDYSIETNFVYDFTGKVVVHPLEQLATFIIEKSELRQDDISVFQITKKIKQELEKVFK
jgi:5S rRNA maturation endonuclease (ribonuclease M5)